jgi:hypothetical protein
VYVVFLLLLFRVCTDRRLQERAQEGEQHGEAHGHARSRKSRGSPPRNPAAAVAASAPHDAVTDAADEFDGNAPPPRGFAGAQLVAAIVAASVAAFSLFGLAVDYARALGRARASCVSFRTART